MEIEHWASEQVGRANLDCVQSRVVRAMLSEALRRTSGNFTHTAALLGVSRQLIQQMVLRFELKGFAQQLRREPAQILVMRI